jgi:hypothetical protein
MPEETIKQKLEKARAIIDEQIRKLSAGELDEDELAKLRASTMSGAAAPINVACDSGC